MMERRTGIVLPAARDEQMVEPVTERTAVAESVPDTCAAIEYLSSATIDSVSSRPDGRNQLRGSAHLFSTRTCAAAIGQWELGGNECVLRSRSPCEC